MLVQITSHDHHELGMAIVAIVLLVASSVLALVTYHQFGWRQRSKMAQDRRVKNVDERQRAQVQVKRFLTVMKLDFQVHALAAGQLRASCLHQHEASLLAPCCAWALTLRCLLCSSCSSCS